MILYMPLVREYLELQSEKEIKDAISKVGGVEQLPLESSSTQRKWQNE